MKVWLDCFQSEKPETLQAAFSEYFKAGKFFPKPADIAEIINRKRAKDRVPDYEPIDRAETEKEQSTPEWEKLSEKARKLWCQIAGGQFSPPSLTNKKIRQYQKLDKRADESRREYLKDQAEQLLQQRGKQQ